MAGKLTTGLYFLIVERRCSLVLRSPDLDPPWIALRSPSDADALMIHDQILIRIKRVMMRKRCCGSRMFFIGSGFGLVFDVNFGSGVLFAGKVVAQHQLYLLLKTLNASNLLEKRLSSDSDPNANMQIISDPAVPGSPNYPELLRVVKCNYSYISILFDPPIGSWLTTPSARETSRLSFSGSCINRSHLQWSYLFIPTVDIEDEKKVFPC